MTTRETAGLVTRFCNECGNTRMVSVRASSERLRCDVCGKVTSHARPWRSTDPTEERVNAQITAGLGRSFHWEQVEKLRRACAERGLHTVETPPAVRLVVLEDIGLRFIFLDGLEQDVTLVASEKVVLVDSRAKDRFAEVVAVALRLLENEKHG